MRLLTSVHPIKPLFLRHYLYEKRYTLYVDNLIKQREIMPPIVPVRVFFILTLFVSVFLTSCGGGKTNQVVENNRIEGVAKTVGRITDLGVDGINDTMTVNGVTYTTGKALFTYNHLFAIANQSEFNLGEMVTIEGTINLDGKTGVVSSVLFDSVLNGPVTKVLEGAFFEVLGQRIDTDAETRLHGFDTLTALKKDHIVEISGIIRKNRSVLATSIRLVTITDDFSVAGYISHLDTSAETFQLNNLVIDYSTPFVITNKSPFENGFYVDIFSLYPPKEGVLHGSFIEIINKGSLEANTVHNIAGMITRFNSLLDFDVKGLPVTTTKQTVFTHTIGVGDASEYALGMSEDLVVSGRVNAEGILEIDELMIIPVSSQISVSGLVERVDLANKTVSVLGITFSVRESISSVVDQDTDESTRSITLPEFSVGEYVHVEAYRKADNEHVVLALRRAVFEFVDLSVAGVVFSSDEKLGVIELMEHRIETDSETEYDDVFSGDSLSKQAFFAQLAVGNVNLYVSGKKVGEKTIKADSMFISPWY